MKKGRELWNDILWVVIIALAVFLLFRGGCGCEVPDENTDNAQWQVMTES